MSVSSPSDNQAKRVQTFEAIPLPDAARLASVPRIVIEFTGIDLAGPSYEGRVFLNNRTAGPDTPMTSEQGYVGAFHVYGYGQGAGGDGHTRLPIRRQIVATEAVRRAAGATATVTLVAVPTGDMDEPWGGPAVESVTIHTRMDG